VEIGHLGPPLKWAPQFSSVLDVCVFENVAYILLYSFLAEIIECWLKSKMNSIKLGPKFCPLLANTLSIISGQANYYLYNREYLSLWRSTRKLIQKWTLPGTFLGLSPEVLIPIVEYTICLSSEIRRTTFVVTARLKQNPFFSRALPLSIFCRHASWNLARLIGQYLRTRNRSKLRTSWMNPCWKSAPLANVHAFSNAAEISWYYLT